MTTPINPDSAPVERNVPLKCHRCGDTAVYGVLGPYCKRCNCSIPVFPHPINQQPERTGDEPCPTSGQATHEDYPTVASNADTPTSNPEGESATRLEEGAVYRDNTDGGLFVCASDKPDSQQDVPCINFDGSCGFVHYALCAGVEKVANSISEYFTLKLNAPAPPSPTSDEARKALCVLYFHAYHAGHNDTVEGCYADVKAIDRFDYWNEAVVDGCLQDSEMSILDSALANLKAVAEAWSPIHYEIDRRADKMHAEADNTDFG